MLRKILNTAAMPIIPAVMVFSMSTANGDSLDVCNNQSECQDVLAQQQSQVSKSTNVLKNDATKAAIIRALTQRAGIRLSPANVNTMCGFGDGYQLELGPVGFGRTKTHSDTGLSNPYLMKAKSTEAYRTNLETAKQLNNDDNPDNDIDLDPQEVGAGYCNLVRKERIEAAQKHEKELAQDVNYTARFAATVQARSATAVAKIRGTALTNAATAAGLVREFCRRWKPKGGAASESAKNFEDHRKKCHGLADNLLEATKKPTDVELDTLFPMPKKPVAPAPALAND